MVSYNNSFRSSSIKRPPLKWVDKSHSYSYTDHLAGIVPTLVDLYQPGEQFEVREATKLWSLPFFAPVFSAMQNKSRFFVVPLRKIVPFFEEWLTSNPSDLLDCIYTTVYDVVKSRFNEVVDNLFDSSLADYLGWPSLVRQFSIIAYGRDLDDAEAAGLPQSSGYDSVFAGMLAAADEPNAFESYYQGYEDAKPIIKEQDFSDFFSQKLSLVPFLAYQKIIDDWLIDQRFQPHYFDDLIASFESLNFMIGEKNPSIHVSHEDSFQYIDMNGDPQLRNVLVYLMTKRVIGYAKDYFTTCSTEQQRGEDIVIGPEKLDLLFDVNLTANDNYPLVGKGSTVSTGDSGKLDLVTQVADVNAQIGKVWAQVNDSDLITPIKLRWQMAFQKLNERMNIGGYSRYTDFVLGQTGIRVPDPYLLRSVYLGGYKTDIVAQPVTAMADGTAEDGSSIIGEVAATGKGFGSGPLVRGRISHDYCVLMCLSWNIAETYYYQGFRTLFTSTKVLETYPFWEFAGVGEQPVHDRELFFGLKPDNIFGYQRRFANHKIYHNEIHGEFRGNLEYFHTGRKFLQQPHLGGDFVYQRGTDGHDRVFSIDPKNAAPFRITKYYYYRHKMIL